MPHRIRVAIGARLKASRLKAKLTQQDVATHFLCSRQAVSAWEGGKSLPDLLELRELASLYVVSTDFILIGVNDSEAERRDLLARVRGPGEPAPEFQDSGRV